MKRPRMWIESGIWPPPARVETSGMWPAPVRAEWRPTTRKQARQRRWVAVAVVAAGVLGAASGSVVTYMALGGAS